MVDRILTPSKITAWLDCAHFLTLQHRVDAQVIPRPSTGFGSMAQLLLDKGLAHEAACLSHYRDLGLTVHEVDGRHDKEPFARWVSRVGNPLAAGHDVVCQMPFVHDGVRGTADFLVKVVRADGMMAYEPVDAKLARTAAKAGHVLQLCFYAEALEALAGVAPEHVHIWLGSGSPYVHIDEQATALHQFDADTPQHLLGDLLGYWRREGRVVTANLLARLGQPPPELIRDPEVLADLECIGIVERLGAAGKVLKVPGMAFSLPAQDISPDYMSPGANVMYSSGDGPAAYASVSTFDIASRQLVLTWNEKSQAFGVVPSSVVIRDSFNEKPKLESISALAGEVLEETDLNAIRRSSIALLRRHRPSFPAGHGPVDGQFTDDLASILEWVPYLDHSVVAVQGPPGTGKTFTGAHIVRELVRPQHARRHHSDESPRHQQPPP